MSSLRNAVKRVTHKERAQPRARAHLGFLEKKQDYKKRAVDYQGKRDRLQAMKLRADMRNPDEFYMGMHNSQVKEGKHAKTEEARRLEDEQQLIGPDTIKLMKNQDLAHVRYQRQKESKKIERLQANLHFLDDNTINNEATNRKRQHIVFVGDQKQAQEFDVAKHFQTLPELAGRAFNRPRVVDALVLQPKSAEDDGNKQPLKKPKKWSTKKDEKNQIIRVAKVRATSYAELEGRMKRQAAIVRAEAHLCVEKLIGAKGRKRKVKEAENGKPAVYKWRRRRAT